MYQEVTQKFWKDDVIKGIDEVNARKTSLTQLGFTWRCGFKVISGVSKDSIAGPIFCNTYFFCIRIGSVHNFADDNILSSFASSVKMLLEILMAEFENAIKRFCDYKIIVKIDKFKPIVIQ